MSAKAILVFCAEVLLVQSIYGQAIPCANTIGTAIAAEELALAGNALAYGPGRIGLAAPITGYPAIANYGLAANSFVPSSGGGFAVQSFSPIAPTGITVISENAIEGAVAVNGEMPFLGAVFVEGNLPSVGAGGINYGCGNGAIGILSEGITPASAAAYPAGLGYAPGVAAGLGYPAALGPRGRGCSGIH